MLIQLPGSNNRPNLQNAEVDDASFEAGLRRDLATSSMVSYDAMLGGPAKRALELAITLLSAPVWAPVLALAAAWAKVRFRAQAVLRDECIGYGGQAFQRLRMRVAPVPPEVGEGEAPPPANDRRSRWSFAIERLPELINVLRGDMALVGPRPLSRDALEPIRSARRYYLSARPGAVGVSALIGEDHPSQYKIYAMSWALSTDALIFWDALRLLSRREDSLWQPSFQPGLPGQSTSGVVVRKRTIGPAD